MQQQQQQQQQKCIGHWAGGRLQAGEENSMCMHAFMHDQYNSLELSQEVLLTVEQWCTKLAWAHLARLQ